MPYFIVNILGGLPTPDGEHILEGLIHELDPEDRWVARAVHFRHLVETDRKGVPLSRAPSPTTLPIRLEEIADAKVGDKEMENKWLEKLLFG